MVCIKVAGTKEEECKMSFLWYEALTIILLLVVVEAGAIVKPWNTYHDHKD